MPRTSIADRVTLNHTLKSATDDRPPLAARDVAHAMLTGLRLLCPRCTTGHMFRTWATLHERCTECGYDFAYAPGEWSGAVMISQMLMGLAVIPVYLVLTWGTGLGFTARVLLTVGIVVALWALTYRNIKGLWFGWLYAAHRLGDGRGGDGKMSPPARP